MIKTAIDFKALKEQVDLLQYAAYLGYKIDKKKSTKTSIAMRKDNSDKVIISKSNGIWIYFSVYDDSDNGTILDFIKNRTGRSIYQIGKELEGWIGKNVNVSNQYEPYLKEKEYDPERVKRLFSYYRPTFNNGYLHTRGITNNILCSARFQNRVFQDQFKNAVFPHFKKGIVCGLELKGDQTSLFIRGSEKTLWRSNRLLHDNTLIIAEAPIDAMSYHIIHGLEHGFYTATSGGLSPRQLEIIKNMVSEFSWIRSVILATDNGKGGDKIASRIENVIRNTTYQGTIERHSPDKRGYDWNDVLNQLAI
ncbi:MAG: toprim domain-containing protein [Bacteroidota bacterium]